MSACEESRRYLKKPALLRRLRRDLGGMENVCTPAGVIDLITSEGVAVEVNINAVRPASVRRLEKLGGGAVVVLTGKNYSRQHISTVWVG